MFSEFTSIIKRFSGDVGIFLHHNADPDAVCSAEAVGHLIKELNPSLSYQIYSDGVNVSAKRVSQAQEIHINDHLDLPNLSLAISVDTGNITQLGKYADVFTDSQVPFIVIDHHASNEMKDEILYTIFDEASPSTCMLVAKLYESLNIVPNHRIATLLICGHLYDSRRFIHGARPEIFRQMAKLLEAGGDYESANEYLQNEMSLGEKIARLKAARRLNYQITNNQIIVISQVTSFESSAARSLVGFGCDIVFVIAKQKDETRGSARATNEVGINVGDILTNLAKELAVTFNSEDEDSTYSGGGHKNAAGINFKPPLSNSQIKKLSKRFFEVVNEELSKQTPRKKVMDLDELNDIEIVN